MAAMEIDKADYALLNAVSRDEWLAYLLNADVDLESIMNMPGHGLREGELIDRFFRLWERGLVECVDDPNEPPVAPDFELARAQLDRSSGWPPRQRALLYRLSAAGGALWESLTAPDWSRFIRRCAGDRPDKAWVLSGGDRKLVERVRRCDELSVSGPRPLPGSGRWEVLQPWRPTYWKTLPIGYRYTFEFKDYSGVSRDAQEYMAYRRECGDLTAIELGWCKSFEAVCAEHFPE